MTKRALILKMTTSQQQHFLLSSVEFVASQWALLGRQRKPRKPKARATLHAEVAEIWQALAMKDRRSHVGP